MKNYYIISILCLLFVANGCKKNSIDTFNQKNITLDVKKTDANVLLSSIYKDIDYIPLETNDDNLIGEITHLITYKNLVFILDQSITKSIFCFDENGKHLHTISKEGHGPGEYVSPTSISIDTEKERLLLLCSATQTVIEYDLSGNYVSSHKLDFYASNISYVSEDCIAFFADFTVSNKMLDNKGSYPNLILTDRKFNVITKTLWYPSQINYGAITMLTSCFAPYTKDTVSLVTPFNDTIYHISKDNVERSHLFEFGEDKKTKDFYSLMTDPSLEVGGLNNYLKSTNYCNIIHFLETTKSIYTIYSSGQDYYVAFYSKEKKTTVNIKIQREDGYPIYSFINDIDGGKFYPPYFSDGNFFYSFIDPEEIIALKESILLSDTPNKSKILNALEKTSNFDNPIIIKLTPL